MRHKLFYFGACLLAACAPWLHAAPKAGGGAAAAAGFPGWPTHFEGRPLTRLPLSEREERFGEEFPGLVARFTDGRREVIVRFIGEATRRLHPTADCLTAIGYSVRPVPLHVAEDGALWSGFTAERRGERLLVRERVYSDSGGSWPDIPAWYWSAATGAARGPWWALTVAERQ